MSDCDRDDVYDATSGACQGRNCPRQQTAGGVGELSLTKQDGSRGEDGVIELGENLTRITTSFEMLTMKANKVCIELASLAFSVLISSPLYSAQSKQGNYRFGCVEDDGQVKEGSFGVGIGDVEDDHVSNDGIMRMLMKSDVARYDSTRSRIGSAGCQVGNIKWCRKLPSFWADCDDGRLDHGKRKPVDGQVVS